MALRRLRTLHNVPTCQLSLRNRLYIFVASVHMHSESWEFKCNMISCINIYFTKPFPTDLAALSYLPNDFDDQWTCKLSKTKETSDDYCASYQDLLGTKPLCSRGYHKLLFSGGMHISCTIEVEVLETHISPYLLFFFSTMRSQMSSTCSVFKSCTSCPRILLSSTLGNKRHQLDYEHWEPARTKAAQAQLLHCNLIFVWFSLIQLLQKYSTLLWVCRSSYIHTHVKSIDI